MKGYSEGRLTVLLTKKALKFKVFGEIVADTPAKALVLLDGNAWDFYNRIAFRKSGRGVFRRSFRRRADAAYVETYRSGHNGAHSKCVSRGNRLEGSNPSVSAKFHEVTPIFCTAMYNEWGYFYANNIRSRKPVMPVFGIFLEQPSKNSASFNEKQPRKYLDCLLTSYSQIIFLLLCNL